MRRPTTPTTPPATEQDAIGKVESYVYDPTGNLTARTDGDAQTTYYAYDPLGRQTQIAFPEGVTAYFAYDANGNLTAAWDDAGGEADTFVYDELDRVTARTIAGVGTLYFQYDLAGRRTVIEDWEGKAVYYTYDSRGLIASVHSHAGWAHYTYDARGAVLTRQLPNGSCTYYAYDAAGRVTSIADRKSDGTVICSFDFERDPNGNILTSEREDGSCWYYEYDGMQRLTGAAWKDGATSLYAYEYGYDRVGNRAQIVANGESTYYSYNPANELTHEVTLGAETVYYAYDGRGNQTERRVLGGETTYFGYNSRNLLTTITSTDPAFTANYFEYNALGQRIRKTDSTGTTYYVWDGLNITHEHDGSGTVTRRYTHGHTPIHGVFSLISVQDRLGCRYCYHMDQVGGIHRMTDAWGNVIKTYEFSPFGRMLQDTGNAPNEFVFPGTYLGLRGLPPVRLSPARIYDAELARFTGRDPLRRAPESALYTYALGAAIEHMDPSGLQAKDPPLVFQIYYDAEPNCVRDPRWANPTTGLTNRLRASLEKTFRLTIPGRDLRFVWRRGRTVPFEQGTSRARHPLEYPTVLIPIVGLAQGFRAIHDWWTGCYYPDTVTLLVRINCDPIGTVWAQTLGLIAFDYEVILYPNRVARVHAAGEVARGQRSAPPGGRALDLALANILAYEMGFHSIAGYTDLAVTGQNRKDLDYDWTLRVEHFEQTMTFSEKATHEIRRELDLD